MKPFELINSLVIPLDMENVDTDLIIPAQFLTKIGKDGYGEHLFERLKEQDPHFIFKDPKYQSAEILITKANFGCGSSREHAVWALQQAGLKVIIAESFSDIFYNNAAKNGLLLICLSKEIISFLLKQAQQKSLFLKVDLSENVLTTPTDNITCYFHYDPFRKACLLKGQDDLDYLLEAVYE